MFEALLELIDQSCIDAIFSLAVLEIPALSAHVRFNHSPTLLARVV